MKVIGVTGLLKKLEFVGLETLIALTQSTVTFYQAPYFHAEYNDRMHKVSFVRYDPIHKLLLACHEGTTFEIKSLGERYEVSFELQGRVKAIDAIIYQEERSLLIALNSGAVRVYTWPFIELGLDEHAYLEYNLHQGAITAFALNRAERVLATGDDSGVVILSAILIYSDGKFN